MNRFNTKGKRTYNVSEIIVGDIVKFKGTRNKGFRRVIQPYGGVSHSEEKGYYTWIKSYFSQVLYYNGIVFLEQPYTSTNSVDKLSHVFRDGTWFKVIKD